jgi:teichuronic acid biosynthesis glycosyltransferase TuaG
MNDDVLVSVIVPTMPGRELKLRRALASVREATIEIEIIIAAQRSGFTSFNINSDFQDLKVKIALHDGDGNAASNRNIGLSQAVGKYIAFLDDDDEFLPEKLAIQIQAMESAGALWSFSNYWLMEERRDKKMRYFSTRAMLRRKIDMEQNCAIATPTVVVSRVLIERNSLRFDANLMEREDIDFWKRLLKLEPALYLPQALVVVNRSISSSYQTKAIEKTLISYFLKLFQYMLGNGRRVLDKTDALRGVARILSSK